MKESPNEKSSRLGASLGCADSSARGAAEVQSGPSSPAGQGESGEVGLADGLPAGWAGTLFGEVCKVQGGYAFKSKEYVEAGVPLIRIGDLSDGKVEVDQDTVCLPDSFLKENANYELQKGDVLMALSGATTGKMAEYDRDKPALLNQRVGRFLSHDKDALSQSFLLLQVARIADEVRERAYGGAQPNISPTAIESTEISLPPKAEQIRIVSAIESLQERSARAKQALWEARPLLSQLRQSVLRGAFSGRLTERWRTENTNVEPASELLARIRTERRERWEAAQLAKYEAKGKQPPKNWQNKYKQPEPVDESELEELPDGWCLVRFANICDVQGGFAFKSKDYATDGVALIRIGDLDDGFVNIDETTQRLPTEFYEQHAKVQLVRGDILIAMSGATTGKMAVFESDEKSLLNQRVGRFVCHSKQHVHVPYLRGLVESIVEDIRARAYGGAQPNISPTEIESTPIALPPFDEQVAIAELIAEARDATGKVESGLTSSEAELTQLDQSILAKAFRGELVPQDPSDEPASQLLHRIRTTRAQLEAEKKATKKKKTTRKKKSTKAVQ